MASRMTRRTFVGWLVRGVAAAATANLLLADNQATRPARAAPRLPTAPQTAQATVERGPVPVRMADVVLAGRDFRTGRADGVRLPAQGGDAWALVAERPGATYTTPALPSAFACSHVGVHWRTDGEDQGGLRVELRASRDGQNWMPWRPVTPEAHGPDRAANTAASEPETFGVLLGGRLAHWLQVRLTFEQAGPSVAEVRGITLTCLDSRRPSVAMRDAGAMLETGEMQGMSGMPVPGMGVALGTGAMPVTGMEFGTGVTNHASTPGLSSVGARFIAPTGFAPAAPAPSDMLRAGIVGFLDRVVSREAWGADEALRFKDGINQWPTAFIAPSLLVVHHTAGDRDIVDAEAEVRSIYAYHAVTQGWGDIGYHLLIDSSGRVYEGRRGREPDASGTREIVSENVVAGHALDYNYGSIGIALVGNFQTSAPGQPMLDALVDALAFMAARYRIDPTPQISYLRARGDGTALWRDELNAVSGHRDCIPTECPGDNVYPLLPTIRERVAEQLGERGPAVRITHAPADRNLWPTDLGFAWDTDPAATEVSTMLAGWRRIPGTDTIEALSGYTGDQRPAWGPWTRDRSLSVPLPPDARGIYTLFVRARDAAGHEGRVAARTTLAVDRHVVADDENRAQAGGVGDWRSETSILGYYGTRYQTTEIGQPPAGFIWTVTVPQDGTYQLQATWTAAPDRTTEASYAVSQNGAVLGAGAANQQEGGGAWGNILDVPLVRGAEVVVILNTPREGVLVADAVRLVLVP